MASKAAKAVLKPDKTVLFISDMQEKFANKIYEFDKIVVNISKLLRSCKILNVPVIVTEQYPEAMGKTIPEIDLTRVRGPFAKTQWSMCTPEVMSQLNKLCDNGPPESIILAGIASHVCIENTAIDLKLGGFEVHTAADCCSSSSKEERDLAFERMKQIGCFIGTTENVVFKLIKDAKHRDFRKIREIIWPRN